MGKIRVDRGPDRMAKLYRELVAKKESAVRQFAEDEVARFDGKKLGKWFSSLETVYDAQQLVLRSLRAYRLTYGWPRDRRTDAFKALVIARLAVMESLLKVTVKHERLFSDDELFGMSMEVPRIPRLLTHIGVEPVRS